MDNPQRVQHPLGIFIEDCPVSHLKYHYAKRCVGRGIKLCFSGVIRSYRCILFQNCKNKRNLMRHVTLLAICLSLSAAPGCAPTSLPDSGPANSPNPTALAKDAYLLLDQGKVDEASRLLNSALLLNPTNSTLHTLRAAAYQIGNEANGNKPSRYAEAGYKIAIKNDPANSAALHALVNMLFEEQRYREALPYLVKHLSAFPKDQRALRSLAMAAYMSGDPYLAAGSLKTLVENGNTAPPILAFYAIVTAAIGEYTTSESAISQLKSVDTDGKYLRYALDRSKQWQSVAQDLKSISGLPSIDKRAPEITPVDEAESQPEGYILEASPATVTIDRACEADSDDSDADPFGDSGFSAGDSGSSSKDVQPLPAIVGPEIGSAIPRMVTLDAVFVRSEDTIGKSYGVNLMDLLQANFSIAKTTITEQGSILSRAFSISQPENLAYSLNIANTFSNRAQILTRPTLTTLNCRPATFFSGQEVSIVSSGNAYSGGDLIEKPIGVSLAVTPTVINDKTVMLSVSLSRSFLEVANNVAPSLNQTLQTATTLLTTNVVMEFDQTLVVSGIVSTDRLRNRQGVPFLEKVPVLQYFTSNRLDTDSEKSVLVFITPRRPSFTQEGRHDIEIKSSDSTEDKWLKEFLRQKFSPPNNTTSSLAHLAYNRYFRYIRRGDPVGEPWTDYRSSEGQMKILKEFLWY